MRLLSYKVDIWGKETWDFSRVEFGNINLLVGDSGTGKTRFLNTLFNMGRFVNGSHKYGNTHWNVEFEQNEEKYEWAIEIDEQTPKGIRIKKESLTKKTAISKDIIVRNDNSFLFNGKSLPKLPKDTSSLTLLKEEDEIKPVYNGFTNIAKRDFSSDILYRETAYIKFIPPEFDQLKFDNPADLWRYDFELNLKLYFLSIHFPDTYNMIREYFRNVFPFVVDCKIETAAGFREKEEQMTFCVQERHVKNKWIPIAECASGMRKVLLIITDVCTLPDGVIYLIDEYENSLGINAIDFFPDFLMEIERDIQFVITSHHPYIINNIPVENWFIFNRKGTHVDIRYGQENIERFGKSKQQRFIQLINDPFYKEGIA